MASLSRTQHQEWLGRITASQEVRRVHTEDWDRYRELYIYGTDQRSARRNRTRNYEHLRINMAHAAVRTILPRIFFRNPRIFAEPRRMGDEEASAAVSLALNYVFDEIDAWKQLRLSITDALIFGIGIIKIGFDTEFALDPEGAQDRLDKSLRAQLVREQLQATREMAGLGPLRPKKGTPKGDRPPTVGNLDVGKVEWNENVIREFPWVGRVSPFDWLIDSEATSDDNARWCAFRLVRPVDAWKKDTRYSSARLKMQGVNFTTDRPSRFGNLEDPRRNLNDAGRMEGGNVVSSIARDRSVGYEPVHGQSAMGVAWEIWDKVTRQVITISPDVPGEALRVVDNPFEMEGFPAVTLAFNEIPDRYWPKSDMADIEPQILELNQVRQFRQAWFRRLTKGILASRKGVVSQSDLDKMAGPHPFVAIEVDGPGAIEDSLKVLPFGEPPSSLTELETLLKRDIRDQIGISEEQIGAADPGVTATASANVQTNISIRLDEKRLKVELFSRDIARKTLQVMRQFFPKEVALRWVGPQGENWVALTAEEIRREYDVRIEANSASKPNDEVRRRQMVELIQVLQPLALQGMATINWPELVRQVLMVYGFADPTLIVSEPQLDPTAGTGLEGLLGAAGGAEGGTPGAAGGNGAQGGSFGTPSSGGGPLGLGGQIRQATQQEGTYR